MSDGIKDAFGMYGATPVNCGCFAVGKTISVCEQHSKSADIQTISYNLPENKFPDMTVKHSVSGKLELEEGTKYDSGKPTTALLPSKPLLEIAKVLDYGAKKYEPHNWRKGISYTRVLSAAQRHLLAWNDGESVDPETNLSHIAHAACNLLFLLEYELTNMKQFDDRNKK
jgi:hypothetical protein